MRGLWNWWRGLNRWVRRFAVLALVLLALSAIGVVGTGYYFSDALLDAKVTPPTLDVEVLDVKPASTAAPRLVTLEKSEATLRDGVFGLDWAWGHAILGRIVSRGPEGVTRRVSDVQGELDRGTEAYVDTVVWNGNPLQSFGVRFRAIRYPDELGRMAAWYVPGRGRTWAVLVHGYKTSRRGGLRDYGVLRGLGMPLMSITYRNDPGDPNAPDGLIQLGNQEWIDLQAAMRWAVKRGARRFVLLGDSMGGAIVCTLYHRSKLARKVDALVLDAPVLDWGSVLDLQASNRGLPDVFASSAQWWVERRIGIDFGDFDQIAQASSFRLPILLFQGTDDDMVPFHSAAEFARALPHRVTFYPVKGAGHVQAWNVGPAVYENRLRRFLAPIVGAR